MSKKKKEEKMTPERKKKKVKDTASNIAKYNLTNVLPKASSG